MVSGTAVALAAILALATAAGAGNGLDVRSTSRYVLDGGTHQVRATLRVTVHNRLPSVRTGAGIEYYFWKSIQIPVPADAHRLKAVSNGATLGVTTARTHDPSTRLATIAFPSNLLYGQSRTITVTFVLTGAKPRSADQTRVGPGYATFAVYGPGDSGQMTMQVVLPTSMTFDASTDLFNAASSGRTTTYTATKNTDSVGFYAVVSARDPALAKTEKVTVSGRDISVMAYPDDPKWASFVTTTMTSGVPALEKILGRDWPGGVTKVREDRAVNVRGYDGWFDPRSDEIVIGEELQAQLLFHELTHAWANASTLDARWMSEGIADAVAERAMRERGGKARGPGKVSRTAPGSLPLNSWTPDQEDRAQAADDYAYPASQYVIDTLLAGCDPASTSTVLADAVTGRSAYTPPGHSDLPTTSTSWERLLDLLEVRGGNARAADVLSTWVLTSKDKALLAPRATARAAYIAADRADGDFVPPLGLRSAMTSWSFGQAQSILAQVAGLGPQAVAVQEAARRNHLSVPEKVAAVYEGADSPQQYAALPSFLPAAARTLDEVGAAERAAAASRNPLGALGAGVLGVSGSASRARGDLDRADLAGAATAARSATDAAGRATWVGLALVVGVLLVLAGLALLARLLLRLRARRPGVGAAVEVDAVAAEV